MFKSKHKPKLAKLTKHSDFFILARATAIETFTIGNLIFVLVCTGFSLVASTAVFMTAGHTKSYYLNFTLIVAAQIFIIIYRLNFSLYNEISATSQVRISYILFDEKLVFLWKILKNAFLFLCSILLSSIILIGFLVIKNHGAVQHVPVSEIQHFIAEYIGQFFLILVYYTFLYIILTFIISLIPQNATKRLVITVGSIIGSIVLLIWCYWVGLAPNNLYDPSSLVNGINKFRDKFWPWFVPGLNLVMTVIHGTTGQPNHHWLVIVPILYMIVPLMIFFKPISVAIKHGFA